ncbi:MAG: transcriptional repressor [Syntrophales bacterium]|nr:transcriptional repressor [Syntrophales bacterium]
MAEKTEKEIFEEYLSRANLRGTAQRGFLLDLFLKQDKHVSAEQLYDEAKKTDSTIGQATVYRILKLLVDAGLAREVDFGDGIMRYERLHGLQHHDHLICKGCSETIEVCDPIIEELQKRLAEQYGYKMLDHELYLYGLCPKCRGE